MGFSSDFNKALKQRGYSIPSKKEVEQGAIAVRAPASKPTQQLYQPTPLIPRNSRLMDLAMETVAPRRDNHDVLHDVAPAQGDATRQYLRNTARENAPDYYIPQYGAPSVGVPEPENAVYRTTPDRSVNIPTADVQAVGKGTVAPGTPGGGGRGTTPPTFWERIGGIFTGAGKQYAGTMADAPSVIVDARGGTVANELYTEQAADVAKRRNALIFAMEADPTYANDPEAIWQLQQYDKQLDILGQSIRANENTGTTARDVAQQLTQSGAADVQRASEGLGTIGRMAVNTGVAGLQMAADVALGALTGGGNMAPMMIRSFGGGTQEARSKGYSTNQQLALGLTNAATEYFTEKLFGGNPIYDKADVGMVNNAINAVLNRINPDVAGRVMSVLSSPAVEVLNEGWEEVVSDLFNPMWEQVITGNSDKIELEQLVEDWVVGVALGGMGTAAEAGTRAVANAVANASSRRPAPVGTETAATVETADQAAGVAPETTPTVQSAAQPVVQPAEIPEITREMVRAVAADPVRLAELGISTKGKDGSQIRGEVRLALETQRDAQVKAAQNVTKAQENISKPTELGWYGMPNTNPVAPDNWYTRNAEAPTVETPAEIPLENLAEAWYGTPPSEDYGGNTWYQAAQMAEEQARQASASSADTISQYVDGQVESGAFSQRMSDTMKRMYIPSQDETGYIQGMTAAYNAGRDGRPMNTVIAPALNGMQLQAAYIEGQAAAKQGASAAPSQQKTDQAQQMDVDTATEEKPAEAQKKPAARVKNPGLIRDENAQKAKLSYTGRRAMDTLAKVLGVNVRFVESIDSGAQGYYDNGEIVIALDGDDPFLTTAVHESVHRIRELSESDYNYLRDFVLKHIADERYQLAGAVKERTGYTAEEAPEEIVADGFGRMLGNETMMKQFVAENSTAAQRIMDVFAEILDRIRQAMSGKDARSLTDAQLEVYKDLEGRLDVMLKYYNDAIENVRDSEGTANSGRKNAIRENAKGQYVQADRQVIFGSDPDAWGEQVTNYINGKIRNGENVTFETADGDLLTLTRTSAEKLGSQYDGNGRTIPEEVFEVKANAAVHIDELIKVAKGTRWRPDELNIHGEWAKNGFNYKPVYFRDFDGGYYKMWISMPNNDIKEVYNLGRIDKRTFPGPPKAANGSSGNAGAPAGNGSSGTNVTQPVAKSKPKKSVSDRELLEQQKQRDADYSVAVESGDMDTAQRMVDEAAKAAGYDTPKLYHGTRAFGFTQFDTNKSDDGISLFATDNPQTAETYSGKTGRTKIKDRSNFDASSLHGDELISKARENNKRYKDYKLMSGKDREQISEEARSSIGWSIRRAQEFVRDHNGAFDTDKAFIMDRLISALYHLRDSETEGDISDAWTEWEDAIWDLKGMNDSIAIEFLDDVDSRGLFQSKNELDDMTYLGDIYADWYPGGPDYVFDNQLQLELDAAQHQGIYELYGKPGKQLVIDANGANWNQITPPEELLLSGPQRTRDIAVAAKAKGYDSILFKSLRDNGGETPYNGESNVYIFFRPDALKSADPVTYDDNGNVIPLSERFNPENEDIRYSTSDRELLDEYIKAHGAIKTGENPTRDIPMPKRTTPKTKVFMTVRTVAEAGATPDEFIPTIENLAANHEFDYTPYSDKKAIADADRAAATKGWQTALTDWVKDVSRGEVSKRNTAIGWALYNNAVNAGDTETALLVLRNIVQHQRNAAQAVQATRILKQLNPETQLYNAERTVESLNDELKKRYGDKVPDLGIDPDLAERFLNARSKEGRDKAIKDIYRDIGRQMPTRFIDRWNAWRYLAMLGNPRTHIRNVVGNAGFAPIVAAKDLTATAIESAVSLVSGGRIERTKGNVIGRGDLIKAAWNDYANVREEALGEGKYNDSAIAKKEIQDARRIFGNTKSKAWNKTGGAALEAARRANGTALDAEDVWFSKPHYTLALAQYCAANNISAGQISKGQGLARAREYAIREAQKATYRDTNDFSQAISRLGRGAQWSNNKVTRAISTIIEGILPFRKTPANILARGAEYSPLGLMKSLTYDLAQVKKGNMSAADMIDDISAGLTGTGLLALGAYLVSQGLLRGRGGDDDKKKSFADLTGHQDYALELPDGTSITLDWLAPEALPMFVGANLAEIAKNRKDGMKLSDILSAIGNVTEPMLEMSCLQSLNNVFEAVGYAKEGDLNALTSALSSAATSYLTQALPTLLGQAERTGEGKRMTTYTDKNSFLTGDMQYTIGKASARIPGVDYNQIPYIDAWGREELTGKFISRALNNFFNPSYISKVNESDMEKELERLYDSTGENVFPQRAPKYFTVDGERKDLTAEEYVKYATEKGRASYAIVGGMTASDIYKGLEDAEKAACVKDAYTYANETARTEVGGKITDSWVEKAKGGVTRGIAPETYILMRNAVGGISGIKDANGNTIDNSKGLQIMEAIYQIPGLNDEQRRYLFQSFGVGKTVIGYNKALVNQKLAEMRKK